MVPVLWYVVQTLYLVSQLMVVPIEVWAWVSTLSCPTVGMSTRSTGLLGGPLQHTSSGKLMSYRVQKMPEVAQQLILTPI